MTPAVRPSPSGPAEQGPSVEGSIWGFVGYFLAAYPRRSALMIPLLVLAGLAQGFGIVTLLPVLDLAIGKTSDNSGPLSSAVGDVLGVVGLEPALGTLLVLITVMITLRGALLWLAMREVGYTSARVAADLRLRFIRALATARWSHFTTQSPGHVASSLSQEANRASWAFKDSVGAMAAAIEMLINLVLVLTLSWRVGLVVIGAGLFVGVVLHRLVVMSRRAGRAQTLQMRRLISRLTDLLPAIKPVKAMHRQSGLLHVLEQATHQVEEAQRRTILALETMTACREPILTAVISVGLFVTLRFGGLELPAVLLFVILFYRVMTRFGDFQSQYQSAVNGESAFWSMMAQIEQAEKAREPLGGTTPAPTLTHAIRLHGVSFVYATRRVLADVDLEVPAGALVVVTGPSGAGKSTLIDLIVGLRTPTSGAITVDDVPLSEIAVAEWRRGIGYVPQDVLLLPDTIAQNVAFGDPDVTSQDVLAALRSADAMPFVDALADGIDHVIGERGSMLSGGQQQRLAIARALVHDPQLLLLDEATSALDAATEAEICRTLRRLAGERTIIAVAHRGAISELADIIVEVADGRLDTTVRTST